jgi:hypothetical protein
MNKQYQLTDYEKWFDQNGGNFRQPYAKQLLPHLQALFSGDPIIKSHMFNSFLLRSCIHGTVEIASLMTDVFDDPAIAIRGATVLVAFSWLNVRFEIPAEKLRQILLIDVYDDIRSCRDLILLIEMISAHKKTWPAMKSTCFTVMEKLLQRLSLQKYLPVNNKRSLDRALAACQNKIRQKIANTNAPEQ